MSRPRVCRWSRSAHTDRDHGEDAWCEVHGVRRTAEGCTAEGCMAEGCTGDGRTGDGRTGDGRTGEGCTGEGCRGGVEERGPLVKPGLLLWWRASESGTSGRPLSPLAEPCTPVTSTLQRLPLHSPPGLSWSAAATSSRIGPQADSSHFTAAASDVQPRAVISAWLCHGRARRGRAKRYPGRCSVDSHTPAATASL